MTNWRRIKRLLNVDDYTADVIDQWEREARDRIVQALVSGMKAEARYQLDAPFHHAIDTLAAIAAAAVFNESALTRDEAEQRRMQFELAGLTSTSFGLSPRG